MTFREFEAVGRVDADDAAGSGPAEEQPQRQDRSLDGARVRAAGVELVDELLELQVVELVEPGAAVAVGDAQAVRLLGRAAGGGLEWPAAPGAERARVHCGEELRERVIERGRGGGAELASADGSRGVLAPGLGRGAGREGFADALAFALAPNAGAVRRLAAAALAGV